MKIKKKISILLALGIISIPILSGVNFSKSFAQEDTSTGWIPDYAVSQIESMRNSISDKEWEEIDYFIGTRNYYALKHSLITIAASSGGWVAVLASNILAIYFTK